MGNLNEHQTRLLTLMKELDGICRKYDIQYYCAGGTVIGAARHRGFIPWDDDIDIYMRRSEFKKFREAFEIEKPKDRALVFRETDEDYYSVIPRYLDTGSTMFCKYNMLGHAPAGTLIDIFIIDPLPADKEIQREYINKLFVYSDLIMPFYSFSHRVEAEDLDIFEMYYSKVKENGLENVLKELRDELFSFKEEECECMCLRWGSIPTIFPKKVFGDPVYLEFEDMKLPVPEDWYEYLCILYGGDWMMVPYAERHDAHVNIQRYDMAYDAFYDYRDEHFSADELYELYMTRKEKTIEYESYVRMRNERINSIHAAVVMKGIQKELAKAEGRSALELHRIFEPYFEKQLSVGMAGKLAHGSYYRWRYPFVIDLSEDIMEVIVDVLAQMEDHGTLSKLAGLYERAGKDSPALRRAGESIKAMERIKGMYYYGEYEICMRAAKEKRRDKYAGREAEEYYRLAQAKVEPERLLAELDPACDYGENINMAVADALYVVGHKAAAEKKYMQVAENTRNGMFWMDIKDKFDVPEIPLDKQNDYSPNDINDLEKKLIDEIVDICDENEIKYVLGPHLSRRLFVCGNFGYENEQKNIYMDAENAARFLEEANKNMPEGRRIFTWTNHEGMYSFEIRYCDRNSVYVRLENPRLWEGMGVNVRIVIIRSGAASKKFKHATRLKEYCLAQNRMSKSDISRRQTMAAGAAGSIAGIMEKVNKDHGKKLFEGIIKGEQSEPQSSYYFLHSKYNERPLPRKYYDEDWKDTTFIEYQGRRYRVPRSATEPHFRNEVKKTNEREPLSHSILYSGRANWEDISPVLDEYPVDVKAKRTYAEVYRKLSESVKAINKAWLVMLCYDDSISLAKDISPKMDELKELKEKNDYEQIGNILSEVDIKMKYYLKKEIKMQLPADILSCYYDYLIATSQKAYVKRFEELNV